MRARRASERRARETRESKDSNKYESKENLRPLPVGERERDERDQGER